MSRFHYHAPLDPECPGAQRIFESMDDPIMRMSGCASEFIEDFEAKHRKNCLRCQEYGAANIEVTD